MFANHPLQAATEALARRVSCQLVAAAIHLADDGSGVRCPVCNVKPGKNGFAEIVVDDSAFRCHGCGTSGDVIELVTLATGLERNQAVSLVLAVNAGQSAEPFLLRRQREPGVSQEVDGGIGVDDDDAPIVPGEVSPRTQATIQEEDDVWGTIQRARSRPDLFEPEDLLGTYLAEAYAYKRLERGAEGFLARRIRECREAYVTELFTHPYAIQRGLEVLRDLVNGSMSAGRTLEPQPSLGDQETPDQIDMVAQTLSTVRRAFSRLTSDTGDRDSLGMRTLLESCAAGLVRVRFRRRILHQILSAFLTQEVPESVRSNEYTLGENRVGEVAAAQLGRSVGDVIASTAFIRSQYGEYLRASQDLACGNLRLVISIAVRYRGRGLPLLDVVQAGNVGLLRACDKFDERLGTKFATYAVWWIRQLIEREIEDQSRLVRLPVHTHGLLRRLNELRETCPESSGASPSIVDLANAVGESPKIVHDVLLADAKMLSIGRIDLDRRRRRATGDSDSHDLNKEFVTAELGSNLRKLLERLDTRKSRILRLRYGLDGNHAHTLEEIAQVLGVTRERIRQIEKRSLEKLQLLAKAEGLDRFLSD